VGWPWWFAFAMIVTLFLVALWNRRLLRGLLHKIRSGRADWNDDWDPFT
jgi:hypothetical protein